MTQPTHAPVADAATDGSARADAYSAGDGSSAERIFSVWAPAATRTMTLHLDGQDLPMAPSGQGWWATTAPAQVGSRYGYRIDGGPLRPSPRSVRQPDGPHGLSQVWDEHTFAWTDQDWGGIPLAGAVFYELHVGTFTPEGTFDAAVARLHHLVELGVDVVEVMPVASFPGRHGWGYDGVSPWAVHEPYGGPEGLARFVDACHARGLAVCLDVVYNHLGPDGAYLGEFGPYFTDRHHTPWGKALNLDGPGSDTVRDFLIGNAVHWLVGFHLDGLRLDAVHELHDERAVHLLEELAVRVAGLDEGPAEEDGAARDGEDRGPARARRHRFLIAESDRNDPRTVTALDRGGLGMDGQWADDVHHALHVALTGERAGYYEDFAPSSVLPTALVTPFVHADTWSTFRGRRHGRPVDPSVTPGDRFVTFLQNHDQIGNRREGDRLSATLSTRRLQCGAALLLTSAYTPLLFMGEEWGASTPWMFFSDHPDAAIAAAVRSGRLAEFARHGWASADVPDPQDPATRDRSVLQWQERDQGAHAVLLRWYKALLALRSARADLRDPDLSEVLARYDDHGVIVVNRGRHRVVVNLGEHEVDVDLGVDSTRGLVVLLATDPTVSIGEDGTVRLLPDAAAVIGPAKAE